MMFFLKLKVPFFILILFGHNLALAEPGHDCICPYDETVVTTPGLQTCGQMKCPACGHHMHRALWVGTKNTQQVAQGDQIPDMGNQPPPITQDPIFIAQKQVAVTEPNAAPNSNVTYTNTIAGLIEVSCARCHSGPLRNLMTYENVKVYADNGLLPLLVKLGGPMNRFAGKNAQIFIDWAKNGAPR